jgi:CBS domain-containing protein
MAEPLLVRDVMRIGVPTCKVNDLIVLLAQQMIEQGWTAVVVMDDDGDARGWINERMLAVAYTGVAQTSEVSTVTDGDATSEVDPRVTAADIMDEDVPETPVDIPLSATIQIMADMGVDHLFFMHNAGGKSWPASVLNLRDVVKALAGPEYIKAQGMHAARPTPMDLFRQRYNLPKK